jgi:cell division GTPase FtsZ
MIKSGLTGVEFIVANTDSQALQQTLHQQKFNLVEI